MRAIMKVLFLGNMNNNNFALCRYLRDRNINASVARFSYEPEHFHPKADCYDLSFQNYCFELPWGIDNFNQFTKNDINKVLDEYDFIIGCGVAPAYCHRADRKMDLMISHGGDLFELTKYKILTNPKRFSNHMSFVMAQRQGIEDCRTLSCHKMFDEYEDTIKKLRGDKPRLVFTPPYVYHSMYPAHHRTHWYEEFKKIRDRLNVMIISQSRQSWMDRGVNSKGSEILIKGFAEYCYLNWTAFCKLGLVLFEYGNDVARSKQLIKDLHIEQFVYWMPKMYRKDLMVGLALADFGVDICGYDRLIENGSTAENFVAKNCLLNEYDCSTSALVSEQLKKRVDKMESTRSCGRLKYDLYKQRATTYIETLMGMIQ